MLLPCHLASAAAGPRHSTFPARSSRRRAVSTRAVVTFWPRLRTQLATSPVPQRPPLRQPAGFAITASTSTALTAPPPRQTPPPPASPAPAEGLRSRSGSARSQRPGSQAVVAFRLSPALFVGRGRIVTQRYDERNGVLRKARDTQRSKSGTIFLRQRKGPHGAGRYGSPNYLFFGF